MPASSADATHRDRLLGGVWNGGLADALVRSGPAIAAGREDQPGLVATASQGSMRGFARSRSGGCLGNLALSSNSQSGMFRSPGRWPWYWLDQRLNPSGSQPGADAHDVQNGLLPHSFHAGSTGSRRPTMNPGASGPSG